MKVKLEVTKAGRRLHEGCYEIDDTESFGAAWQDVWVKARERYMAKATSKSRVRIHNTGDSDE